MATQQADQLESSSRSELLKRVYKFDWLAANMYDLTLNTDRLSLDYATDCVLKAVEEMSAGG